MNKKQEEKILAVEPQPIELPEEAPQELSDSFKNFEE